MTTGPKLRRRQAPEVQALELPLPRRSREFEDCDSHLTWKVLTFLVSNISSIATQRCAGLYHTVFWRL